MSGRSTRGLVCLSGLLCLLGLLGLLGLPGRLAAAPLDLLLTAAPERQAPRGVVEFGVDRLNRSLDFATSNDLEGGATETASGRYQAETLSGGLHVAEGLWLSAGYGRRRISTELDTYRYRSWQAAGQFRFLDGAGPRPALALRLSAWGNGADATVTTAPIRVPGAVLNTVTVSQPADRQLQADLIGTWDLSPTLELSAVLGAGRSRLRYAALAATTTRNGCLYDLRFTGNDILGTLVEPCESSGGVIRQFFDSSGDYGIDVANEIAWRGRFAQAGVNARWRAGPWTLHGGYMFHTVRREAVDDILARRGKPVHEHNHLFALEADYRFTPRFSAVARAQISSNLFFNDVPVTYNTSTSASFGSRLSLFTLGLRAVF